MTCRRVAAVVAGTLVLAGCSLLPGDSGGPAATPDRGGPLPSVDLAQASRADTRTGGTLRLAVTALPENFNAAHTSNDDTEIDRLLGPTRGSAVRVTADGGWEVDPDYARSVEVVDRDPFTVRVELNPDAVWEGGTPITSADMVAQVDALDGSDDGYETLSTQGYEDVERVDPDGDDAYTVTFDDPTVDWPRYVYPTMPEVVSASKKFFNTAFTSRSMPSNGPYRVVSIDRDTGRVVQEPNPRWWGATPRLKRIVWQAATPATQLEAVAAGDLDAIDVPAALQSAVSRADLGDDVVLRRAAGTEWTQLTMNGAEGPLEDVRVRRAVARALDRRALAALSTRDVDAPAAVLGSFVYLPGQVGYTDQSDRIAQDLDRAAELLDRAGWKLGAERNVRTRDGKPLTLRMPVPEKTGTNVTRARLIADQLRRVGIGVELQPVSDRSFFSERIIPLDFDLATFTHTGSAFPVVDAKALFTPVDSGQNFTGVSDSELAGAWDKAIAATSAAERFRVVRVLDRRLFRDVPLVPLGVTPTTALVSTDVVNYGAAQFELPDWTRVGFRSPSDD